MSNGIVLLTGGSGFVGFRILEQLLDQGWHVRLAVRSESKLTTLKKALEKLQKDTTNIEHVIVPDMMAEDAFQEAIKGVSYVIHVASPLPSPSDDIEASVIKPAVTITTNMLKTLLASPSRSVKKLVITSSIAAVFPLEPTASLYDADNVTPDPEGPWTDDFAAYAAGKKLAYNATRRIIAEQKPYFDVINIMPSFVIGPNDLLESRSEYASGSNALALAPLLGMQLQGGRPGSACHVDDVAAVHVAALQSSVEGHRNFGVNFNGRNGGVEWNAAIDIVKEKMPEAVGPNGLPLGGSVQSDRTPFDASKTERELGMEFKNFESMIVDLAGAYMKAKL